MKIKDCQTLPEFFGVEFGGCVWVEGHKFEVRSLGFASDDLSYQDDARALVGCLTGQLEWSKYEPMTAEEEKILREIAAWFPYWKDLYLDASKDIRVLDKGWLLSTPFRKSKHGSKAYEILAPILEKHGGINLDKYRGNDNERD